MANHGLKALLDYCQQNGRVCPNPLRWKELWEALPERQRVGRGWQPPQPLILGAWWHTSDDAKRRRLSEHIEWADARGALEVVDAFLRGLSESDWHHVGQ